MNSSAAMAVSTPRVRCDELQDFFARSAVLATWRQFVVRDGAGWSAATIAAWQGCRLLAQSGRWGGLLDPEKVVRGSREGVKPAAAWRISRVTAVWECDRLLSTRCCLWAERSDRPLCRTEADVGINSMNQLTNETPSPRQPTCP